MVNKTAFLFPGQGSQYVGMAKFLYDSLPEAKKIIQLADKILGYSISQIMFDGPEEKLKETEITQPALFVASAAALEKIKLLNIKADVTAGHSLGEYSALYSAGVLNFEDALRLVHARGKAMQKAGSLFSGTMAAILGLSSDKLDECLKMIPSDLGVCQPANYNSAAQIVISGTKAAVQKAMELSILAGALKAIPLNVSGAFHSDLMSSAAEELKPILNQTKFSDSTIPVITNVDAFETTHSLEFKEKLYKQINHSVKWAQTMDKFGQLGVTTFLEIGSGKVLSMLIKKYNRSNLTLWTDDLSSIENKFQNTAA